MIPADAVNFRFAFGPYKGQTIGWIAKVAKKDGLLWMLRMYQQAKLGNDTLEALRVFFAAPKHTEWLRKSLPSVYLSNDTFLLPRDSRCCRACGEHPMVLEEVMRCSHGRQRGLARDLRCPCGYRDYREVKTMSLRQSCAECDDYPLFAARSG